MLPEKFKQRMKTLLKEDYEAFIANYDEPPKKSFFINTNKISEQDFLTLCDFKIEKRAFGYRLLEDIKIGKTPEHHAGMIYMQELSAMMPVNFLPLNNGDVVLDLCASPGGKSIQVANKLQNGFLVSNEIVKSRAFVLQSNIERMGLTNVCVTNNSPNELEKLFQGMFDAIVVDAPCSGEGMFRKEEQAWLNWSQENVEACAIRQLAILESANNMLKNNGYLLYSTCTFSVEEDEMVIAKFCEKHNYDILPLNYEGAIHGERVLNCDTDKTLRFYPHKFDGEGQFVALLQKKENSINRIEQKKILNDLSKCKFEYNIFNDFCKANLYNYEDIINNAIINNRIIYYTKNKAIAKSGVNLVNCGVVLGEIVKDRFEPNHNLFTCFGKRFKKIINLTKQEIEKFLNGETINYDIDGYVAVSFNGVIVGFGKGSQGIIKNHYPKKLRN